MYSHEVAIHKRSNPAWSTGQDKITGKKSHDGTDVDHQLFGIEVHVLRGSHLAQGVVDMAADHGVTGVKLRIDPGTKRTKGVKTFGARPLTVDSLQISCGDIVGDGKAENGLSDIFLGKVSGFFPHNNGKFRFVFNPVGLRGDHDGLAIGDQGRGGLHKDHGIGWHFVVHLCCVFCVVPAYRDDLAGLAGQKKVQIREQQGWFKTPKFAERIPLYQSYFFLGNPAKLDFIIFIFESYYSHFSLIIGFPGG